MAARVSSYGVNQAIAGQPHSVAWDRLFAPSVPKRGVIGCAGHNTVATSYLDANTFAILAAGIPVCSFPHAALWGNATAQGYIGALRTYAQANWGFASGTVDLVAGSAGAAAALNWTKANPTLVRRIALLIPAVDLQDIETNNRGGYSASIQAAHGGPVPDASNPADNTASFSGFAIKCWYSSSDTIVVPSVVTAFCAATGAEAVDMGAIGHSTSALDRNQLVSFLSA